MKSQFIYKYGAKLRKVIRLSKKIGRLFAHTKYFSYFCGVITWMADMGMLAVIWGLTLSFWKRRLLRFASDALKLRNFHTEIRAGLQWTSTITCIYARHKCALSQGEGVLCAIHICLVGVGVPSCFLSLFS